MKRFFFLASASAVAVLAACSTSSTTGAGDACSKYFDTMAQASTRCDTGGSSSFDPTYKSNFIALCQATVAAPGSGITNGYLSTCGNAIASSTTCNFNTVPGCENPAGTLTAGAACYSSVQCQSGACTKTGSAPADGGVADAGTSTGPSCGKCEARAPENAACDTAGVTAPRCMSGLTCTNGTCVKQTSIPAGGACSYSGPPGTNCATGTTCIPGTTGSGTCDPLPKKGEKCTFVCDTNLTCTAGTCQDKVALGGACPTGNECQSTLYCDKATKVCSAYKTGKAGDTCGSTVGVKCDTGLSCQFSGNTSTCVALKNKGEACVVDSSQQCAPFLECISGSCQVADPSQCK